MEDDVNVEWIGCVIEVIEVIELLGTTGWWTSENQHLLEKS